MKKSWIGNNLIKEKTKEQIADMLKKKKFEPKSKALFKPKTDRSYHIDSTHALYKESHVGVHRFQEVIKDKLDPRNYPLEQS